MRNSHLGFVFQSFNLIPVLTARENVALPLQLQGMTDKKERVTQMGKLLEDVGIGDLGDRRPSELSGGQQQRVAIARALIKNPTLVLADEPTANLDSSSTRELLDIMQKMNKESKITFLFSTHDQRVVDKARRIITIDDGKVASDERIS